MNDRPGDEHFEDERAVEPDGVISTALQLLPIPPHEDDFWARLEASLDLESPHELPADPVRRVLVAGPEPGPAAQPSAEVVPLDASLAVVPPAFRRTSNMVLGAVAATALVVVFLAGTRLLQNRDGTAVESRDPSAEAALETLVRSAQDGGGTVTTLSAAHEDESSEAVLAWVDDLGAGDVEAAWSAMGDLSQAQFASQGDFEADMTDLAEGYGAWSAAEPDEVLVTPVATSDDSIIAVVTLIGMVEQEGTAQARADAFPVRIIDGDVALEPFASAGQLEVVIPEPVTEEGDVPEPIGTDEELVFVLPSDVQAPVLRIDGGDTVICGEAEGTEFSDLDQSDGQRCAYLPEDGFAPGAHTVTIAFLGPAGDSITAESFQFEAA